MNDELNILAEMGNIAASHGSVALSELLGRKISLALPEIKILPAATIRDKFNSDTISVGVYTHVFSGLKSNILFMLDEQSAFRLIDACSRISIDDHKSGILTEIGVSIVKEVGSIVISACMGSLSTMLHTLLIPSTPTFMSGPQGQILSSIISPYHSDEFMMCSEAILEEPTEKIQSRIFLTLNPQGIEFIQNICKKELEGNL